MNSLKHFFPYNPVNEARYLYVEENVGLFETDTANVHIITRPFCDTIYKLKGDSLFAAYNLVFPLENTLPASFFSKAFKNKTERDNFYRNNGWMLRQVHNFYETPRFIYFLVGYLSNFDTYVYEKQTDEMYKTKNIKPDTSHYNLQLLQGYGISRASGKFYKSQIAGDLLAYFDKNKNVPIPKDLEQFIKSKPPASTPVIVEFTFKKTNACRNIWFLIKLINKNYCSAMLVTLNKYCYFADAGCHNIKPSRQIGIQNSLLAVVFCQNPLAISLSL